MTPEPRQTVIDAIKAFSWHNYGMDEVDPDSEYAEWVPALAADIVAALKLTQLDRTAEVTVSWPDQDGGSA